MTDQVVGTFEAQHLLVAQGCGADGVVKQSGPCALADTHLPREVGQWQRRGELGIDHTLTNEQIAFAEVLVSSGS